MDLGIVFESATIILGFGENGKLLLPQNTAFTNRKMLFDLGGSRLPLQTRIVISNSRKTKGVDNGGRF